MVGHAPRILVIEDDPLQRHVLFLALTEEGYEVDLASGGLDGMAAAMEARPAAVLLDLGLADVGGVEVGQLLRRTLGEAVRIIVISGDKDLTHYAADMGADAWLAKPFRVAEMLTTLRQVLGQSGSER